MAVNSSYQRLPIEWLLITGHPNQHLGVDVGLFRAERPELLEVPVETLT